MPDVMLDLETLGTRPGCAILSIGAVAFDRHSGHLGEEFYIVVNRKSCAAKGMKEDAATLQWWLKQSVEARKVLEEADVAPNGLGGALVQFTAFLQQFGRRDLYIFGNGSDFDQPILSECYDRIGYPLPWLYYNNRCFRTLKDVARLKFEPKRYGTHHNALDDAKSQALQAIECFRALRNGSGQNSASAL